MAATLHCDSNVKPKAGDVLHTCKHLNTCKRNQIEVSLDEEEKGSEETEELVATLCIQVPPFPPELTHAVVTSLCSAVCVCVLEQLKALLF